MDRYTEVEKLYNTSKLLLKYRDNHIKTLMFFLLFKDTFDFHSS